MAPRLLRSSLLFLSVLCIFSVLSARGQGNALTFSGTGQDVAINTTLGNFGTNDFTMEVWIRTSYTAVNQTVISKRSICGISNFMHLNINASTGKISFEIDGGGSDSYNPLISNRSVNDGKWHHIALVKNSVQLLMYVDGVVDIARSIVGNPNVNNGDMLRFGSVSCAVNPFIGSMDEVRFYNAALTEANIITDMNSITSSVPASLTAYYNFDAGTGTTLADQTGNGNTGVISGSTAWTESYAMVAPVANYATGLTGTGFTASWTAPATGTVTNYILDVSSNAAFTAPISGSPFTVAGTSQVIAGLNTGTTTYYYRVRADKTSITGQGAYSAIITAPAVVPTVLSTTPVTVFTSTTAQLLGTISSDGGTAITDKGVVYNTSANPTIATGIQQTAGSGMGVISVNATSLTPATTYHFRAYATNGVNTSYGSDVSFTTALSPPATQASNITTQDITANGVTINWTSGSGANRVVFITATDSGTPGVSNLTAYSASAIFGGGSAVTGTTASSTWYCVYNGTGSSVTVTNLAPSVAYRVIVMEYAGTTGTYAYNMNTASNNPVSFTTTTGPPVLASVNVLVGNTTATFTSNVTAENGSIVTERGFVWSTVINPTIADNKITLGIGSGALLYEGIGVFSLSTTYHVRAYAINSLGISYSADQLFTTLAAPTVTAVTLSGTNLVINGANFARKSGSVNDVVPSKVTITGEGDNSYTLTSPDIEMLSSTMIRITLSAVDQQVVLPMINKTGTVSTGGTTYNIAFAAGWLANEPDFAIPTKGITATITAPTISNAAYLANTAELVVTCNRLYRLTGSNNDIDVTKLTIKGEGGATYTLTGTGVEITNLTTFTVPLNATDKAAIDALLNKNGTTSTGGTTYNITGAIDWAAGTSSAADITNILTVSNLGSAIVSSNAVSAIMSTSAILGGNVTNEGSSSVTERGIVWGTGTNPTIANNKVINGSGAGSFSATISSLPSKTTVYFRAYATSLAGTAYGANTSFITLSDVPVLTTDPVTVFTATTATVRGVVTATSSIDTERGVVYATTPNPTIGGSKIVFGSSTATGDFASTIQGLSPSTTYYLRAYATNTVGTSYGEERVITTTAPTTPVSGFGNALHFDGVNDYVSVPDHISLRPTAGITIEAWVNVSTFGASGFIVGKENGSPQVRHYLFQIDQTRHLGSYLSFSDGSWTYADAPAVQLPANTWTHVAMTYDNTVLRFYINGTLIGTTTHNKTLGTSGFTPVTIGARGDGFYFDGKLDEVQIWNRALSASELSMSMYRNNQTIGLVGYWKLNESSGTAIADSSPAGNNGTMTNMNPATDHVLSDIGDYTLVEDAPARSGFLAGSDGGGTDLTYSILTNGTKGMATITDAATGAYTYMPTANANGADNFTYRVNNGTNNSNTASINVNITSVIDAPTLSGGNYTFATVDANVTSASVTVDTLLARAGYAHVETGALKGIAITTVSTDVRWEYSPDAGNTWLPVNSGITATNALLLSNTALIRFAATTAETATITFKAWDQTVGTASGITHSYANSTAGAAFSTGTGNASITVANNPPVNAAGYPKLGTINSTSIELLSKINETGTTYYVMIPESGTAPTTAGQIKAGQDGASAPAYKAGSFSNTANTEASVAITGFTAGIPYRVYIVSQDAAPVSNLQTSFTTLYPSPSINVSGTITALTAVYGAPSATPSSFQISGSLMAEGIKVKTPAGFEVSTSSGSGYLDSVTVGTTGTITATTIYVRLKGLANAGSYSGNITITSNGATTASLAIPSSTVSAKAITVTATGLLKTYGTALTASIGTTNFTVTGTLVTGETITGLTFTPDAAGLSATTAAGAAYVVTPSAATGTGGFLTSNYNITYTPFNGTVSKAALTITADNQSKAYNVVNPPLTMSYAGFVNADNAASLTTSATISTTAVTASPVGNYPIIVSGAVADNYEISYVNGNMAVGLNSQTITFAALPAQTYGNADFAPGATSTNNSIPITYSSSNTAVATIVSGNIHIVGVGTTNITALQAGNSNYGAATNIIQLLTVNKAALTITANAQSKTYGTANPALTVSYAGFVNGDTNASLTTQPILNTAATISSLPGTYSITASGAVSSNYAITYATGTMTITPVAISTLSGLSISGATLSPAFASATTNYTASVVNSISSITITPVTTDGTATIKVNGITVTSGSTSAAIPLAVGNNTVTTIVTAQNGVTTQTYTVSIVRESAATGSNSIATLGNLSISGGTLSPAFATATTNYTLSVPNALSNLVITPVTTDAFATIKVNNVTLAPGGASQPIALAFGNNTVIIEVTAQDGITKQTYTIVVNRPALTIATLNNLTISSGTLSPVFSTGTSNYTVVMPIGVSDITFTPTYDVTASATIYGTAVPNGSASYNLLVAPGNTVIPIIVTAQDGVTKNTYTVTVTQNKIENAVQPTNIMSPNGDGINDAWVIKDIELYPNNVVTIYDRAGRIIYTKKGYFNDWTGTINNAPLTQGTYFYIINLGVGPLIRGYISILTSR